MVKLNAPLRDVERTDFNFVLIAYLTTRKHIVCLLMALSLSIAPFDSFHKSNGFMKSLFTSR